MTNKDGRGVEWKEGEVNTYKKGVEKKDSLYNRVQCSL